MSSGFILLGMMVFRFIWWPSVVAKSFIWYFLPILCTIFSRLVVESVLNLVSILFIGRGSWVSRVSRDCFDIVVMGTVLFLVGGAL